MIVQNLRIIQWKATRMLRRTSTLALWEKPEERGLVQPGLGGSSGGIQQQWSGAGHSSGDRDGFFKEMRGRCTRNYSGTLEQKSYKVKTNQHPDFLRTVKHSSRLPTEAALCLSDFQTPQYPALRNLIWPQCYPCTQQHLGLESCQLSNWWVPWSCYTMASSQMPMPLLQGKYGFLHLIRKLSENVANG